MSAEGNVTDPYIAQFTQLLESVQRLEEALDSVEETMNENHREAIEAIRDLQDSGSGFTTFES